MKEVVKLGDASIVLNRDGCEAGMKKIICYLFLSMLISGCASVLYRSDDSKIFSSKVYPGVSSDLELIDACSTGNSSYELASPELNTMSKLIFFAALIDVPFSFVLDTILLPLDIFQPKIRGGV